MHPLSEIRIRASLYPRTRSPHQYQPQHQRTSRPESQQVEKPESWRAHHQHRAGCHPPVMVIAQCNDCTLQSLHIAIPRTPPARWQHHRQETKPCNALPSASGLPRQLPDKSESQQIDKSEIRKVGKRPHPTTPLHPFLLTSATHPPVHYPHPPRSRPPSCLAGRPPPAGPSPLARFHALSSRGDPHQHQPQHQRVNKPRSRKAGKLATTPPTPYSPPPDPPSAAKRPTVAPLALPAG